jgi:hypothetical protein
MLQVLERIDAVKRRREGTVDVWSVKAEGRHRQAVCGCMAEDPGDGEGERVLTHSMSCPLHPDY